MHISSGVNRKRNKEQKDVGLEAYQSGYGRRPCITEEGGFHCHAGKRGGGNVRASKKTKNNKKKQVDFGDKCGVGRYVNAWPSETCHRSNKRMLMRRGHCFHLCSPSVFCQCCSFERGGNSRRTVGQRKKRGTRPPRQPRCSAGRGNLEGGQRRGRKREKEREIWEAHRRGDVRERGAAEEDGMVASFAALRE